MSGLLLAAVLVPALLALAWPWSRLRPVGVALAPWAAIPGLALSLVHFAGPGTTPSLEISILMVGLRLGVDGPGGAFLLLASFLWLAAGIFARSYHARDPRREAFFAFFVLTMTGNLGVILAQDLVSFYLFFALMTFSAYGLVIHHRDRRAIRAGRVYLVMAIGGELALLVGVLALVSVAGGAVGFGPEMEAAWAGLLGDLGGGGSAAVPGGFLSSVTASPTLVAGLLLAGFGVKAGLAPLHIWLPLAHPVAPTAASALLSGVLIKAGLLGWLRVLPVEVSVPSVGTALLLAGAATALYGVLVGLAQDEAKAVLAYSSVSQMGYMAMGTGLLALEPRLAPVALAAVIHFALHHGVAKGALFLSVGVVDRLPRAGLDTPRWRRPILAGALLPVLALSGAPLTAGLLAKTELAHALVGFESTWTPALGHFLVVGAGGTALLMARFLVLLNRRTRRPNGGHGAAGEPAPPPWGLVAPWVAVLGAVVAAPLWVVHAHVPPEAAGAPGLTYMPPSSWLPLLLATILAAGVLLHPGTLGRLARVRIPPGDILLGVERPLRRLLFSGPDDDAPAPFLRYLARVTRGHRPPISSAVFGLFLLALALALTLALLA